MAFVPFQDGYDYVKMVWHDDILIDVNIGKMRLHLTDSLVYHKILWWSGNGAGAVPYNRFV